MKSFQTLHTSAGPSNFLFIEKWFVFPFVLLQIVKGKSFLIAVITNNNELQIRRDFILSKYTNVT